MVLASLEPRGAPRLTATAVSRYSAGRTSEGRNRVRRWGQPPIPRSSTPADVPSQANGLLSADRQRDSPSQALVDQRFGRDYRPTAARQSSTLLQRVPAAPSAATTSRGPSEATLSLLSLARLIEQQLAEVRRTLGASPGAEAQHHMDAVTTALGHLRAVAAGADERQKLAIGRAFAKVSFTGSPALPPTQRAPVARMPLDVSEPGDASEVEAERVADAVVRGSSARILSARHPTTLFRSNGAAAVAGTLTAFELAGGSEAEAATGPPGWVVGAAIGVVILGALAIAALTTTTKRPCPPCPPNPPPEIDRVPPSAPHFPCPGDHWHYRQYNQNPTTCQCFLSGRLFGGCLPQGGFPT